MKVSYNWLKEFLEGAPAPKELGRALTMTGTEVESLTESGAALNNVVVAEIISCGQHPNADRLKLCEVKTATDKYSIVCGASNMKAGDKVALALIGAELPGGVKIKKSKIRGVESQGMMCSEVELGIKDTSEGILILPPAAPLGANINDALSLGDAMMEIGVTPNRSDLLSIRGVAREASAVTDAKLKEKSFSAWIQEGSDLASTRCYQGVKSGKTPSNAYARDTTAQCRRRVALAGYRLADLINQTLGKP